MKKFLVTSGSRKGVGKSTPETLKEPTLLWAADGSDDFQKVFWSISVWQITAKLNNLKQQIFIISVSVHLSPPSQRRSEAAMCRLGTADHSRPCRKYLLPGSLTGLLARSGFSRVVGHRASDPWQPLAKVHPWFLHTWASPQGSSQPGSWLPRGSGRKRGEQEGSQSL